MDNKLLFASTALLLFSSIAFSREPSHLLQGEYRVRGECAEQLEDGSYRDCVAWNTLVIKDRSDGRFDYSLDTVTFATTQGGCGSSGILSLDSTGKEVFLRGTAAEDVECKLSFKVTPKLIELVEPAADSRGCRSICGHNSSLYTDPFPRKSRRRVPRDR